MSEGVDYSFSRPSPAALRAAGKSFVCRYLSGDLRHDDNGQKDLSVAEKDALLGAGLAIVVVWETDGRTGPLSGANGGHNDAVAACSEANALGVPHGACIYFAVDFGASQSDAPALAAYAAAARDVCHGAGYRAGIYGGLTTEQEVGADTDLLWQTYAWSGGNWHPSAQLRQYENGATVADGSVDLDESTTDDFGQFPVIVAPAPQPVPSPPSQGSRPSLSVGVSVATPGLS